MEFLAFGLPVQGTSTVLAGLLGSPECPLGGKSLGLDSEAPTLSQRELLSAARLDHPIGSVSHASTSAQRKATRH